MFNHFKKSAILLTLLIACGREHDSQPQLDEANSVEVSLSLASDPTLGSVELRGSVMGCVSGYADDFSFPSVSAIRLLIGDFRCDVVIHSVEMANEVYEFDYGTGVFNPAIGSFNVFVNSSGKRLILKPKVRVPSPIGSSSLNMSYQVSLVGEGDQVELKANAADLIPRLGLLGWYGSEGKFVLDSARRVMQWRSLVERPGTLRQGQAARRPTYLAGGNVDFSRQQSGLVYSQSNEVIGTTALVVTLSNDKRDPSCIARFSSGVDMYCLGIKDGRIVLLWIDDAEKVKVVIDAGKIEVHKAMRVLCLHDGQRFSIWINGQKAGDARIAGDLLLHGLGATWDGRGKLVLGSFAGRLTNVMNWSRPLESSEIDWVFDYLSSGS